MSETPKVLIVDDEDRFRTTMIRRLKGEGITAFGVGDGESALEELSRNEYDVVLLDVKMPGIDGIETLKHIKDRGVSAEVIILSGHACMDAAMDIMACGAYEYLLKPCGIDDLMEKILVAYDRKKEKEKNAHLRAVYEYFAGLKSVCGEHTFMIINSLLDTDLYKLTMMQGVLHQFPWADVEYEFRCRDKDIDLRPIAASVSAEISHLCTLRFTKDELNYLRTLRFMKEDVYPVSQVVSTQQ
ncbi:MAG: response regulator [Desulfobacteraceae bacterium]|nr:response regulator [Desulfobacteraceae bacterium]